MLATLGRESIRPKEKRNSTPPSRKGSPHPYFMGANPAKTILLFLGNRPVYREKEVISSDRPTTNEDSWQRPSDNSSWPTRISPANNTHCPSQLKRAIALAHALDPSGNA